MAKAEQVELYVVQWRPRDAKAWASTNGLGKWQSIGTECVQGNLESARLEEMSYRLPDDQTRIVRILGEVVSDGE